MKSNQLFCLVAIYKDYEVNTSGIPSPALDAAQITLYEKGYIKPNGLGYDLTDKGNDAMFRLLDAL